VPGRGRALGVGPGPQGAECAAGHEDTAHLVQGGDRIHPVPGRRGQHGIGASVGEGDRLAPPHHGTDVGNFLGENRTHAVIGLDGDDLTGPVDQESGQRPGAGPEVDDCADARRKDPVHRGSRWPGAVALVVRGHRAEAPRASCFFLWREVRKR
jgi:hypothetical protein